MQGGTAYGPLNAAQLQYQVAPNAPFNMINAQFQNHQGQYPPYGSRGLIQQPGQYIAQQAQFQLMQPPYGIPQHPPPGQFMHLQPGHYNQGGGEYPQHMQYGGQHSSMVMGGLVAATHNARLPGAHNGTAGQGAPDFTGPGTNPNN